MKNQLIHTTLLLALTIMALKVQAKDDFQTVAVADPYIDIRTGPGRGYPIFYVVERGKWIAIIKRRTQWYKVRRNINEKRYKEGWVHVSQLVKTLDLKGDYVEFKEEDQDDFIGRQWEAGALGGDFAGANQITMYSGYQATKNISLEVALTQAVGNFSDSLLGTIALAHQPFPHWRASPFFLVGAGKINTEPKATLVRASDRNDNVLLVGAGIKLYITRRFFLRMEYKSHVIQTNTDENEEVEAWQLGFSVFF